MVKGSPKTSTPRVVEKDSSKHGEKMHMAKSTIAVIFKTRDCLRLKEDRKFPMTKVYHLEFGSSDGGGVLWHGLYAEVLLYDRALNSSELGTLDRCLFNKYIPEPASFILLGLGSLVLLLRMHHYSRRLRSNGLRFRTHVLQGLAGGARA